MTQTKRILKYISDHGSISNVEAVNHLHVARLASRIHDIRKAGIKVNGRTVYGENEYGKFHYTRYSLD